MRILLHMIYSMLVKKAIGYLPITFLEKNDIDINVIMDELISSGLSVKHLEWGRLLKRNDDKEVNNGAHSESLWAWDVEMLDSYLITQIDTLKKYDWPSTADEFVEYVMSFIMSKEREHDLFEVIARAFNDPRYR